MVEHVHTSRHRVSHSGADRRFVTRSSAGRYCVGHSRTDRRAGPRFYAGRHRVSHSRNHHRAVPRFHSGRIRVGQARSDRRADSHPPAGTRVTGAFLPVAAAGGSGIDPSAGAWQPRGRVRSPRE